MCDLDVVQVERLAARTRHGTVVVDLRTVAEAELTSGSVFVDVGAQLARLGGPVLLRVWMLPGWVLQRWSEPGSPADPIARFSDVACSRADADATVICGPYGDAADAVLFLLRSMGHQLFTHPFTAEIPVLEVRQPTGQIVAGVSAAPLVTA